MFFFGLPLNKFIQVGSKDSIYLGKVEIFYNILYIKLSFFGCLFQYKLNLQCFQVNIILIVFVQVQILNCLVVSKKFSLFIRIDLSLEILFAREFFLLYRVKIGNGKQFIIWVKCNSWSNLWFWLLLSMFCFWNSYSDLFFFYGKILYL